MLHPAPAESPLEQFLDKNFRKIAVGLLIIIAGVVIASILRHRAHEADTVAAIAASQAKTPEDCDLVVANHPGTTAAGNALIKKASLLWEANKKDSSLAVLTDFVSNYKNHPFFLQGISTLATRQESLGKLDEARKLYEQILADFPNEDLASLAQLRLGDILWQQGKESEAKKMYEELPRKFPGSPWFEDNQSRLEWIGAALPTKEVDAPKPPPAPPAAIKAPAGTPPAAPTATMLPGGSAVTNPAVPAPTVPPIKLGNGATSVPVTIPQPPASTTPNAPKSAPAVTPPAPPAPATPAPATPEKPAANPK